MVKKITKGSDDKYTVQGKKYSQYIGSRASVYHGTAFKTSGGLQKKDLMMNKNGRIVSLKKHKTAKNEKRLEKAGYFTKKGTFGYVKKDGKTKKRKARKSKRR
jgi:hypothetical protein